MSPQQPRHRTWEEVANSTSTPPSPTSSSGVEYPQSLDGTANEDQSTTSHSILSDLLPKRLSNSTNHHTPKWLRPSRNRRRKTWIYLNYYIPCLRWMPTYRLQYLTGDLIAALTMASFYIPMSLSYASNLGHIPPVNGMYSFAINPLIYALLGTCPQMVVGPEAPGSLLTGDVVRDSINRGHASHGDGLLHAQIAGVVTGVAGAILLIAGITRLGFLDNVLSRPFLRGFISSIGLVILIDQAIPELGLSALAATQPEVQHGSPLTKFIFILRNIEHSHALTAVLSLTSFAIIFFFRWAKTALQPRYKLIVYLPDRFLVVLLTTILSWKLDFASRGVPILGDAKSAADRTFQPHFPFDFSNIKHLESALSTSFLVALLGFFESSVAAKSLSTTSSQNPLTSQIPSANRELLALGLANITGGIFMALPAFGGYGRSRVNSSTGGTTPMSSVFLSLITVICIYTLLPAFRFIPRGVLSAMISLVAYGLIAESPADLRFFIRVRAYTELTLIAVVVLFTLFYSLPLGIASGIGLSLLRVIKHATRPRIQILSRVKGTKDVFENAEILREDEAEFFAGVLMVKIPEPLTFANTGALRARLGRLERYGRGWSSTHPGLPPAAASGPGGERDDADRPKRAVIFDAHGVTSLDGAGAQVLSEILQEYQARGVRVWIARCPGEGTAVWRLLERSGVVEVVGGRERFVGSVSEALEGVEREEGEVEVREDEGGRGGEV